MDKRTMYVIYSLKADRWSDYELCKRLNTFYDNKTYHPFTRVEIDKILRECCADFIATSDDPAREVRRYFLLSDTWSTVDEGEYHRMCYFLGTTQVRDSETREYINGFEDMEGFD